VVGLVFGSRDVVTICGGREVLEVLQREEFQARPFVTFFKERSFGKRLGKWFRHFYLPLGHENKNQFI
jgi:hypothetical protein